MKKNENQHNQSKFTKIRKKIGFLFTVAHEDFENVIMLLSGIEFGLVIITIFGRMILYCLRCTSNSNILFDKFIKIYTNIHVFIILSMVFIILLIILHEIYYILEDQIDEITHTFNMNKDKLNNSKA